MSSDRLVKRRREGLLCRCSTGHVLYDSPSVRSATIEQLLGMKLGAWRDAVDRSDARLLLSHLRGDKEAIWNSLRQYVSPTDLNKASYAFDDLWDVAHGT